ncbi:hypothetical protein [Phaeobacter sp. C3_T13_0]|uniref:hypothetical protein n=1 Tax=Phaeobacter cretensis TaxID=3342641 RepID=UPI0039BCD576
MKPGFALSLSSHGVSLLQRAAGGWRQIGTVPLDDEDLDAALANLRQLGERHAKGPIACKVVIPNDQIRYLTFETGTADATSRRAIAEQGLDGSTPYRVDELSFDLSEDGSQTHVAAVARETLQEAEDFALAHGFLPISFVAIPGDMDFLGEPFFGSSQTLLQSGETPVEPDGISVVDIGPADPPEPDPTPEPEVSDQSSVPEEPIEASPGIDELNVVKVASTNADSPAPVPVTSDPQTTLSDKASAKETKTEELEASTPAEVSSSLKGTNDPAEATHVAAGFSTRRRKEGPARPVASPLAEEGRAPVLAAPTGHKRTASTSATALSTPNNGGGDNRLVPHAAFGSIALADSTPSIGDGAAKAQPLESPTVPAASTKGVIPAAPKSPGPTPVLPRDDVGDIALADTPTDKQSLHEVGKASVLAGVSKGNVGGKPRFLGLALMAALLIFMAIVATWAILAENQTRNAVSENTTAPIGTEETEEVGTIAPQVSAIPDQPDKGPLLPSEIAAAPEGDPDTLSSTDTAVLDALRIEQDTDPTAPDQQLAEDLDAAELAPEGDSEAAPSDQDTPLTRAAQYAATGIWQHAPDTPEPAGSGNLDNLYVASIDPTDISEDAIALPAPDLFVTDLEMGVVSTPTAAGQQFELDERGLVKATPEGTLNPDGIMVFLGRPEKVPPPTPARPDPEVAAAAEEATRRAILSELRPKLRPSNLVEQNERAQLGGLSRAELGVLRPKTRPQGLKPPEENTLPPTAQAIARSVVPRARPTNFANLVDRAKRSRQRNPEPTVTAAVASAPAPRSVTPRIPSSASVARQATVNNAINLRRVNLIGVYGTPANRRALVLMPNGRYKKVKVGDKIDGGRVLAIGDSQLQYQKGSRNLTLKIPSG